MLLLELFDRVYPWTTRTVGDPDAGYPTWVCRFTSEDGRTFDVIIAPDDEESVELSLLDASHEDAVDVTGLGDAYRVFGTTLAINDSYAQAVAPETIRFSALDDSHAKLYRKMFARRKPPGYDLQVSQHGIETEFVMNRLN